MKISMVDFLNYDGLSDTDIRKKQLKLMEKVARYKHCIAFIYTHIHFNVNQENFR